MGLSSILTELDGALSSLVSQWNGYSTGIATVLVLVLTYAAMTRVDPDIHPMLLARQAQASPIRNQGESPVYRGNSAPHGLPLNSGLNVKEKGASKWSQGRDGDLRDVWRRVVSGTPEDEGPKGKGSIITVHGKQRIHEHRISAITRSINLIGQHITSQGGSKIAIYLPNSVELMATLFVCSFYNLTAILVPFNQPEESIISMLQQSGADTVVALAGAFPLGAIVKSYPALKNLIWVVEEGNKHLDWNEVPEGMGGIVNVATWQDVLNDNPVTAGTELPASKDEPKEVIMFWQSKPGALEEMVSFTQRNIVSAISAQLTAVPTSARLSPSDLFLPAVPLTSSFPLMLTLAALYSSATVAFNSVAGNTLDIAVATAGIAPTVIVATPQTLKNTHLEGQSKIKGAITKLSHWVQTRSLVQNGAMPAASFLANYNDSLRPSMGATPGKLRLLYTFSSAGTDSPLLSEQALSDLRIFSGARVIYALTAPKVAGSVAQTQFHDYRIHGHGTDSHFGPPVSSVEVYLKDKGNHKTSEDGLTIEGEIVARGPSVAGGVSELGVIGKMCQDNTLSYVF